MSVLPRATARAAAAVAAATATASSPRCASALADAAWARSRALRRSFTSTASTRTAAAASPAAAPTGYTAYTLPKGDAIPAMAPQNKSMDASSLGETAVTLEAPRRAVPNARAPVAEAGAQQQPPQPQTRPRTQTPPPPQTRQEPPPAPGPATASSPSPPTATKPRPRRTLRPRKAAVTLTPAAVAQLRELLSDPEPRMIRIGVRNKGCSGLAYHLEYVRDEDRGRLDEEVEQDGVKVLVESRALMTVIGSEMDWVEDRLSARFVFRNPNIKETCGCGESFMV